MFSIFFLLCCAIVDHSSAQFDPIYHHNWHLLQNRYCDGKKYSRILGGSVTDFHEFPWIAGLVGMLERTGALTGFHCIGSILTERVVLTAAHCVTEIYERDEYGRKRRDENGKAYEKKIVKVVLGDYNKETDPDCDEKICSDKVQTIDVAEIIFHSSYDDILILHDIALVRLAEDIQFTSYAWPICLPTDYLMGENFHNWNGTIAGWGMKNVETREFSDVLLKVDLPIFDGPHCSSPTEHFDGNWQICAGGIEKDVGACKGDSGGPLMIVDDVITRGAPVVYAVGIVSHGLHEACAHHGDPHVLTRITPYMPWILDNLAEDTIDFVKV